MIYWRHVILMLFVIIIDTCVFAQTMPPAFHYETTEFSYQDMQNTLNQIAKERAIDDDILLNKLLATPMHKRQYTFPQLHENPSIPNKILYHPDIFVWKGKVPTHIPPRLSTYAKKHLKYLPASSYPLLDPDLWYEEQKEKNINTALLNRIQPKQLIASQNDSHFRFPDVKNLYHLSEETKKNYQKTDLTQEDISRLFNTIKELPNYVQQKKDHFTIQAHLVQLMLKNNNIRQDLSYPFASLVNRMAVVLDQEQTEAFFKKHGWKNAMEFAQKSDRILKAYRVHYLPPNIALQLNHIRAYPKDAPTNETIENLRTYAAMHEVAPGDVFFVKPYLTQIRKNLKPDFLLFSGTPIYIE